jgi:hypothetical protein
MSAEELESTIVSLLDRVAQLEHRTRKTAGERKAELLAERDRKFDERRSRATITLRDMTRPTRTAAPQIHAAGTPGAQQQT